MKCLKCGSDEGFYRKATIRQWYDENLNPIGYEPDGNESKLYTCIKCGAKFRKSTLKPDNDYNNLKPYCINFNSNKKEYEFCPFMSVDICNHPSCTNFVEPSKIPSVSPDDCPLKNYK